MTNTNSTHSSAASGTSSNRTGRCSRSRRPQLSPAQREAADAARAAKIATLHEQIGEQIEQLTADPQWRAMLDTAAKFHTYSLNNQLLIVLQAARLGISPTRVAGFGTWKALGRNVVKGSTGLAVLAPCTYTPKDSRTDTGTGQDTRRAAPAATTATATGTGTGTGTAGEPAGGETERPAGARVLRGFRVAHVFDISQTDGDPLPEIRPELLTGDAPAALWEALAAQVAAHGYSLTREDCGQANGLTDPAARTVRVRPDVADAQAVKTLAHELAHIECGHTADGYDYRGCRRRAEAEAESVAYIVTAWAGLDSGAYTVPYVAAWSAGNTAVVRAAAVTVTAAARRILDHLEGAESAEAVAGEASAQPAGSVEPTARGRPRRGGGWFGWPAGGGGRARPRRWRVEADRQQAAGGPAGPTRSPAPRPPSHTCCRPRLSDPIGTLKPEPGGRERENPVIFEPRAADLDPVDMENALLRAALGDYSDEAAILLLITSGHWLPQLQHTGLIAIDGNVDGEGLWAHIAWPDLDAALRIGTIIGSSSERRVLEAAASIADGHPVDLGDLAAGLERRDLTLVLAAIAHAAGSHEHHHIPRAVGGFPHPGARLPPLVSWPQPNVH